jgi:Family of unknown function (DUF6152)
MSRGTSGWRAYTENGFAPAHDLNDYLNGLNYVYCSAKSRKKEPRFRQEDRTMNIWRGITLALSLGLLLTAPSLFAHHGVPAFDMSRTVTIKGSVVDYQLINPHMLMRVKVIGDDGNSVEWLIESVSALMLMRMGFTRDTFRPGDAIAVLGHANKDGKPAMVLVKFILADGREMLPSSDSR